MKRIGEPIERRAITRALAASSAVTRSCSCGAEPPGSASGSPLPSASLTPRVPA